MRKKPLIYLFYFLLIAYLLANTGIFSDEFAVIERLKGKSLFGGIAAGVNSSYINVPFAYLTHFTWYYLFRDYIQFLDLIKIFYIILSFYLISKFFSIFLNENNALWASFLFIFFPCHDSTVYCFMIQYLTLSFAFYLYAFYLAYNNKLLAAFLLALVASFLSYGSPPLAFALFTLFALKKEFKKSMIMLIPNMIYWVYFIPLNILMRLAAPRIIEKLTFISLAKQFILQILTGFDAVLGPSIWLKIYYGLWQVSAISLIIGILSLIVLSKIISKERARHNPQLIISLLVMLVISFFTFAASGRYPQIAFNLGNRVTIYGSLVLTYFIVSVFSKRINILLMVIFIFSILGISNHWKNWNFHQWKIIENIKSNKDLGSYREDKIIFVSGNQYSKYGPISHIEFFSEDWVPNFVFKLSLGDKITAAAINKRFRYLNGYLTDTKYNKQIYVGDSINIYNSEENMLFKLKTDEVNSFLEALPVDNRHWIQIIHPRFLKNMIEYLMPRLKYAL